jgi:hypothetical protein
MHSHDLRNWSSLGSDLGFQCRNNTAQWLTAVPEPAQDKVCVQTTTTRASA